MDAYRAWTLELFTMRHHSQHIPLITMVLSIMAIAAGPLVKSLVCDRTNTGKGQQTVG